MRDENDLNVPTFNCVTCEHLRPTVLIKYTKGGAGIYVYI